ncbi:MAG: NmrA family NAD(P)-binding protein [Chloroflexota bacterium]
MILVTGGTGFIGQAVIRHLVAEEHQVRTLLRPSKHNPDLPKGTPVEVMLSAIDDERSLRPALSGVETIYHLVGVEWQGVNGDLVRTEIEGTKTLLRAAKEAGVKRIIYLSHLGAERPSAFPVLKVKGIVEEYIKRSGLEYSIIRPGLVFGPNDNFITSMTKLLAIYPGVFFLPDKGDSLLQPIWVEDLATCLTWLLEKEELLNQTIEIGGPEFLTIREVIEQVMAASGMKRFLVGLQPSYLRLLAITLEYMFPAFPHSVYWLDYLAANRTCEIDSVSRIFGLLPVRLSQQLGFLEGQNWRRLAQADLIRARSDKTPIINW